MKTNGDHKSQLKEQSRGRAKARRSQRLALQVPVLVYEIARDGQTIVDEEACAVVVSKHGAMLILNPQATSARRLVVMNKRTKETRECRVVFVGPGNATKRRVGVEFVEDAPNFWGIFFPPMRQAVQSPDDTKSGRNN